MTKERDRTFVNRGSLNFQTFSVYLPNKSKDDFKGNPQI